MSHVAEKLHTVRLVKMVISSARCVKMDSIWIQKITDASNSVTQSKGWFTFLKISIAVFHVGVIASNAPTVQVLVKTASRGLEFLPQILNSVT